MSLLKISQLQDLSGNPILYDTGTIVQTVFTRTDAFTLYAANNSGNGTTIVDLNITITPKNPNNRLIMYWNINCEVHYDTVFLIHRNNSLILDNGEQGLNANSTARNYGYIPSAYDLNDQSTTPSNYLIIYSQLAGSTATRTYSPAIRSSGSVNYTLYLNRTIFSTGQDGIENMVSSGVIYEVAQ